MSEQSSQERERPFLETKRILAGTAAGAGVQASSVSVMQVSRKSNLTTWLNPNLKNMGVTFFKNTSQLKPSG